MNIYFFMYFSIFSIHLISAQITPEKRRALRIFIDAYENNNIKTLDTLEQSNFNGVFLSKKPIKESRTIINFHFKAYKSQLNQSDAVLNTYYNEKNLILRKFLQKNLEKSHNGCFIKAKFWEIIYEDRTYYYFEKWEPLYENLLEELIKTIIEED